MGGHAVLVSLDPREASSTPSYPVLSATRQRRGLPSREGLPRPPTSHLLANPKSTITGTSLYEIKTLAGLMSLISWGTPEVSRVLMIPNGKPLMKQYLDPQRARGMPHDERASELTSGVPQLIVERKLPRPPTSHLLANPKSTITGTSLYEI
jgi:hypothetical protein